MGVKTLVIRKKLVATVSRREGVYNRTGEPSVTFCEKEEQVSGRMAYFLSQLLSKSNPLSLGLDSVFYPDGGIFLSILSRRRGLRIVRDGVFFFKANAVSHSLRRSSLPRKAGVFAGTPPI